VRVGVFGGGTICVTSAGIGVDVGTARVGGNGRRVGAGAAATSF
jgi:hypothetical protein